MASLVGVQSYAHAAPQAFPQCTGAGFLFDGWFSDPHPQTSIEGVSANIRVEDGALCASSSGSYNTTSTWVMIEPTSSDALAQVGFWRYPTWQGSDPQFFYESGATNAGTPIGWHSGVPVGTTHRFWVQWVTNGCPNGLFACFAFNIDTTRIGVSNFNPYDVWGSPFNSSTAWNMQFMGEVHDDSSDIMGGSTGGVATVWTSEQAQDAASNNYRNFTCNLTKKDDDTSRYGLNGPGTGGCGTWSTFTIGVS
jgi:hypothetical protein